MRLRLRDVVARYTPRTSGRPLVIRHHELDYMTLDELFSQDEYALPPKVNDILRSSRNPRVLDPGADIALFGVWLRGPWRNDCRPPAVVA
jgi:hypothetical protein